MSGELWYLSLADATGMLAERTISSVELTRAVLERIDAVEPLVHAYASIDAAGALAEAEQSDRRRASGETLGRLDGVPVSLKDLIDVAGMPTGAGSRVRDGVIAERDAGVVEQLRAGGAVIVGKTVTHEFAFGAACPPALNAWDQTRIPGGSSGGAGVSVATGTSLAAIGTDTGSSVRNPSALNGVSGLKPTYGRVSRRGVIPCAWSLDHLGPVARSAVDCGIVLDAIAGWDAHDLTTLARPADRFGDVTAGVEGLRVGVCDDYFFADVRADVEHQVRIGIAELERLGAIIVPVDVIEHVEHSLPVAVVLCLVEAVSYHDDEPLERRHLYSDATRLLLEAGRLVPATTYLEAQRVRTLIIRGFDHAFAHYELDALVSPTSAVGPLPVGVERISVVEGGEERPILDHYARPLCPFNVTGMPALTVPCGFDDESHPVGMHLAGRLFDERTILSLGAAYQQVTDWHLRRPPVAQRAGSGIPR